MPDTSTIIMCGAGAVAVAFAAASIGIGRVLLAADEGIDRWSGLPELPVWMGMDLAPDADQTVLSAPVALRQSGGQIAELFMRAPDVSAERLSKRAARRARGKEAAARRRARLQGRG